MAKELIEILLVEDDPADADMLRELFLESKIANNLHVVSDAEGALEFLLRRGESAGALRPDLVLLDLGLPKRSGLDLLSNMKTNPDLRRIPVIILTNSRREEDVVRSYDLHANSFIEKPFSLSTFFEVVRSIEDFWFGIVRLPPR